MFRPFFTSALSVSVGRLKGCQDSNLCLPTARQPSACMSTAHMFVPPAQHEHGADERESSMFAQRHSMIDAPQFSGDSQHAAMHGALVALGDPVTDIVVQVTAEQLLQLVSAPGGCSTIDAAGLQRLQNQLGELGKADTAQVRLPGGSAANAARCAAQIAPSLDCRCASGQLWAV